MGRFGWIAVACACFGLVSGAALAGELAIDGVPVERVTMKEIKAAERPITVSTIKDTRLGNLTVECSGAAPTCTVESDKFREVDVLRTTLSEPPRSDTTIKVHIKVEDTMAVISVMWEDCRAC